jgi:hypothetical protein
MLFSERIGVQPLKTLIQVDSIDDDLRNGLWNALNLHCFSKIDYITGRGGGYLIEEEGWNEEFHSLFKNIWLDYFKILIDTLPEDWKKIKTKIQDYFFSCHWYQVYDFIEFIALNFPRKKEISINDFVSYCNKILEREVSAFRFIGLRLAQITNENEINEIEKALENPYRPVGTHLKQSLELLSDRKNPDYRNSIKESISAVEALCKIISNDSKTTLGQALKIIEQKVNIHPALKSAFSNLYGYTNDESGIRHSLMEECVIAYEDAIYMLVSCSAFTNYIIAKINK